MLPPLRRLSSATALAFVATFAIALPSTFAFRERALVAKNAAKLTPSPADAEWGTSARNDAWESRARVDAWGAPERADAWGSPESADAREAILDEREGDDPPAHNETSGAAAMLIDRAESETCPPEMILVEGDYCPEAQQACAKWMESPDRFSYARCAEFNLHPICQAPREHKRYCIDAREYTPEGASLPAANVSFREAELLCGDQGKRLCLESEWEFACEGEGMSPYPYGFVRDSSACNFEKTDLFESDGSLRDLRKPSGSQARCASPFRVQDMVGNVDEWTVREDPRASHRSALRGGWWMPGRNRCRGATTAHDEVYRGPQTGFRCCAWPR